jgi:hypothetical protein
VTKIVDRETEREKEGGREGETERMRLSRNSAFKGQDRERGTAREIGDRKFKVPEITNVVTLK